MIRILFFSDTHLGFDFPLRKSGVHRRRGVDFFTNYNRVLQRAVTGDADLIIHGGDLFFRSRVPDRILELAYGPLIETARTGMPVCIVPGNHGDYAGKNEDPRLTFDRSNLVFNWIGQNRDNINFKFSELKK